MKILKKTISTHHHDWHTELFNALWVDKVTPKAAIGNSPFFLVYGTEALLPPNLFLPSLQLAQSIQDEDCLAMEKRINTLIKHEEERDRSKQHFIKHQQIVKSWFDQSSSSNREFQVGDLVLKWDKVHEEKGHHTKFQKLWLVPFVIAEKIGPSTFCLQTFEGQFETFLVNGLILKKYFC